ncbi:ABC transporter ATP-binding protein [Corynebacterium mendelii]|uniref:Trehalose import ATP-binding protein SugC n=1 Tax=Corynebacterium mendelii TaxID=2765362 RepID=A0A939IXI2_9CORY|nr:ATP-binding cassette domain-containing protein [Corynebacterium mendelii]MBN9644495.1 ATP-binding cassette domain-containing protein [Corynebacterium mendelii]
MANVIFDHATRQFDDSPIPAVNDLTLTIDDGECVVFVGPSGCGKSTSLRMVAGLEPTTSGTVLIGEKDVTGVRPRQRDVAMVFQSYALYPNMTVAQNMAFALENQKLPKDEIRRRVTDVADMLELTDLVDRKPAALSGGQRQRVAMGRAIVRKPRVFCMDEPLSNLDAKLRVTMRGELASLQRRLETTTIYVTHDQTEAMTMGHRVAVLKDGQLQQIDTPETLYANPVNTFVAGFIGSPAIGLFDCPVDADGRAHLAGITIGLPREVRSVLTGDTVCIGIRPESWRMAGADEQAVELSCQLVEMLGSQNYCYGQTTVPVDVHTSDQSSMTRAKKSGQPVRKKSRFATLRATGRTSAETPSSTGRGPSTRRIAVMLERGRRVSVDSTIRVAPIAGEIHVFDPVTGTAVGRV